MRVMRIRGVLAVALCALGGVASSASAEMVLPSFSVQTGVSGTGGASVLFGAIEIKCADLVSSMTMNADRKSGTYVIRFLGCKGFGEECHTEGDTVEVILLSSNWQLVLVTTAGVDHHFILFEVAATTLKCKFLTTTGVVKGAVLGEITQTGANTFSLKTAATSRTGQEFKEYENDEGTLVQAQLLSNMNGGAFGLSGENAGSDNLTSEENTTVGN